MQLSNSSEIKPFAGKSALVTGAASGIGREVARLLALGGAAVLLLDRDGRAAADVARTLNESTKSAAHSLEADLAKSDQIASTAASVFALSPEVDILINSAGISQLRPWDQITTTDWDRLMDVNLKGLFFLTQAIAPRMVAKRWGRIVNIASVGGKRGGLLTLHYAASKAGVISVTRSLSLALAPHNITVNAVCPGYVETALTQGTDRDAQSLGWGAGERAKQLIPRIPLGRAPEVTEVAAAALFLASDQASYITGQSLNVDGGVVND